MLEKYLAGEKEEPEEIIVVFLTGSAEDSAIGLKMLSIYLQANLFTPGSAYGL